MHINIFPKTAFIPLIVMFITFNWITCCKPNEPDCGFETYKGFINANINEESWSAYPYALETSIIGIVGDYYDEPSCRLEQTITIIIPAKQGHFILSNEVDSITNIARILFTYKDDDLILGYYTIPDGMDNGFIDITNYNVSTKKIVGSFSCTLYLYQNFELPADHPDSLVITNGQFETYFAE